MIIDNGERRSFGEAVRDMSEGKGRCDLLPLDVISSFFDGDPILLDLHNYQASGNVAFLWTALHELIGMVYEDNYTAMLELAVHFEEGAKKYAENNWRRGGGIPEWSYIDSAVRHYLKFGRGDDDEDHVRAFMWNIVCLIYTHLYIRKGTKTNDTERVEEG